MLEHTADMQECFMLSLSYALSSHVCGRFFVFHSRSSVAAASDAFYYILTNSLYYSYFTYNIPGKVHALPAIGAKIVGIGEVSAA